MRLVCLYWKLFPSSKQLRAINRRLFRLAWACECPANDDNDYGDAVSGMIFGAMKKLFTYSVMSVVLIVSFGVPGLVVLLVITKWLYQGFQKRRKRHGTTNTTKASSAIAPAATTVVTVEDTHTPEQKSFTQEPFSNSVCSTLIAEHILTCN